MPLLLPFRRAGYQERALQIVLYPTVVALAIFILLPFVLMIALSFGDPTDWWRGRKWPDLRYLVNGNHRYVYYLGLKYDYWATWTGFNDAYGTEFDDSRTLLEEMPEPPPLSSNWQARAADGVACLKERIPWTHTSVLFTGWGYYRPQSDLTAYTGLGEEAWKKYLRNKYGSIGIVNEKFETEFLSFAHIQVPMLPKPNQREACPCKNTWLTEYGDFVRNSVRPHWRQAKSGAFSYRAYLESLSEVREGIADASATTPAQKAMARLRSLNHLMGTKSASWKEVQLPTMAPANSGERTYWERYVREVVNPHFLAIDVNPAVTDLFRSFLLARHGGEEGVRAAYGSLTEEVRLPATVHAAAHSTTAYQDWDAFVRTIPLISIRINSREAIWEDYLKDKYMTVEALNKAYGAAYAAISSVPWPQPEIDRLDWTEERLAYIGEMIFKNYRRAWNFIAVGSPALINTARFAILFTIMSVIINTTAGYALSRFALGPGQIILVGFLAMAAFPLEAIAVPNFLLLRKLGLLNTIWALVLPTVVNGYFIYLMKTVFDGIPKHYYEQAQVEGANDWTVFWKIALPFARPMIAVVGLYAFLWSYSNFMWALIVCQQRTQWTLPVFIFNVNSTHTPVALLGAMMVLISIPPLIVFIFAQRALQRSFTLPRT